MKKTTEMNGLEKIAYKNIKGIFNWEVGGWFNCVLDHCEEDIPDSIEDAKRFVYEECLEDSASIGHYRCGGAPKEMRFAGEKFIKECIDHLFANDEDVKEISKAKGWQ